MVSSGVKIVIILGYVQELVAIIMFLNCIWVTEIWDRRINRSGGMAVSQ